MENGENNKMNLQQILDELKNIKEQAMNDDDITKDSIIEAIKTA